MRHTPAQTLFQCLSLNAKKKKQSKNALPAAFLIRLKNKLINKIAPQSFIKEEKKKLKEYFFFLNEKTSKLKFVVLSKSLKKKILIIIKMLNIISDYWPG